MADQNPIPPNLPVVPDKKPLASLPPPSVFPAKPAVPVSPPVSPPMPAPTVPPASPLQKSTVIPVPEVSSKPVRSFIRTMEADIKAVQAGKLPQGVEKQLPGPSSSVSAVQAGPVAGKPGTVPVRPPSPVTEVKLGKIEQSTLSVPVKDEPKISINLPKPAPTVSLPAPKPVSLAVPPSSSTPLPPTPSRFSPPSLPPLSAPKSLPSVPLPPKPVVLPVVPVPTTPKPPSPSSLLPSPVPPKPVIAPATPPLPIRPPEPKKIPPPLAPLPLTGGISVPTNNGSPLAIFSSKNMVLIGAGVLILVAVGFGYWFIILRNSNVVVVTPTPSPSISRTPSRSLSRLFGPAHPLPIVLTQGNNTASIIAEVLKLNLLPNQGRKALFSPQDENGQNYSFGPFLEKFLIDFPVNLLSSVDEEDFGLILTEQQENFDARGSLIPSDGSSRVALIVRVTDAEQVRAILAEWEGSLFLSLNEFLALPETAAEGFLTANYREVLIRYYNFPHPHLSIDYAVVTAVDNDDYFVIASSREQIFSVVDTLLGF